MNTSNPIQQKAVVGPIGPMVSVLVRTGVKSRKGAMKQLEKSYPNIIKEHRQHIVERWWAKRKKSKTTDSKKPRNGVAKRKCGRPASTAISPMVTTFQAAIQLNSILEKSKISPETAAQIASLVQETGGPKEVVGVLAAAQQLVKVVSR